jgi:hypothetical protein
MHITGPAPIARIGEQEVFGAPGSAGQLESCRHHQRDRSDLMWCIIQHGLVLANC